MDQPSLYFMLKIGVKIEVQEDDFPSVAPHPKPLEILHDVITEELDVEFSRAMGRVGRNAHLKVTSIKTDKGIYLLSAEKHTDNLLKFLGLDDSKPSPTQMVKRRTLEDRDELPSDPVTRLMFRSGVGILRFDSDQKPETSFATKELNHALEESYPADISRL